ncbi:hypothetical protein JTB14_003269 [Gonioctena quinquepunctata]|nr:hypothetical protein JTB14_003269 [Gonioctena quinquepunctata]
MPSQLARVYDSFGFLTPLILLKVLIQKLWALDMEWDRTPSADIMEIWVQFLSEFEVLSKLQIPCMIFLESCHNCELYDFCNASERGYAAVTYLKFIDSFNNYNIAVIAESRVALLGRISIPRLELCAASLLPDLIHLVEEFLSSKIIISEEEQPRRRPEEQVPVLGPSSKRGKRFLSCSIFFNFEYSPLSLHSPNVFFRCYIGSRLFMLRALRADMSSSFTNPTYGSRMLA